MIKAAVLLLVAALLVGPASAQIKKSGSGYLLRVKLTKGQTIRHKISTTVTGLPSTAKTPFIKNGVMKLTAPLVEVVQSVTGNVASIDSTMGPFMVPGNPSPLLPTQRAVARMDDLGNPVDGIKGSGFYAQFPKAAVKVGQTWTGTVPMTAIGGGRSQASANFSFQGIKRVNGKDLGMVALSVMPSAQVRGGKGTMYFLPANGVLASLALTIEMNNPQQGSIGPVKVLVAMTPG